MERCNWIVFADGYYWHGFDTIRICVPEKDVDGVPSSAYWKISEVDERLRMLKERMDSSNSESIYGLANNCNATASATAWRRYFGLGGNIYSESPSSSSFIDVDRDYCKMNRSNFDLAIDIGSCPGGWSHFLAAEWLNGDLLLKM